MFMKNFLAMYPDYGKASRQVTLSGESYSGKYVPYYAARILDNLGDQLSLANVLIGNPYTSPVA